MDGYYSSILKYSARMFVCVFGVGDSCDAMQKMVTCVPWFLHNIPGEIHLCPSKERVREVWGQGEDSAMPAP